jgi:hypothetical protein
VRRLAALLAANTRWSQAGRVTMVSVILVSTIDAGRPAIPFRTLEVACGATPIEQGCVTSFPRTRQRAGVFPAAPICQCGLRTAAAGDPLICIARCHATCAIVARIVKRVVWQNALPKDRAGGRLERSNRGFKRVHGEIRQIQLQFLHRRFLLAKVDLPKLMTRQ